MIRRDIHGQGMLLCETTPCRRIVAQALDCAIDEARLERALIKAGNVAFKKFKGLLPNGMQASDFKQEVIARIYLRVERFRQISIKSFENHAVDLGKKAALDILKKSTSNREWGIYKNGETAPFEVFADRNPAKARLSQLRSEQPDCAWRMNIIEAKVAFVSYFESEPTQTPERDHEEDEATDEAPKKTAWSKGAISMSYKRINNMA